MGLRMFLFAPALVIMLASIMLGGANNQNAVQGSLIENGNNSASFCSANGCVPPGTSQVITCTQNTIGFFLNLIFLNSGGGCQIAPNCIRPVPHGAFCAPWPFSISFPGTYIPAGTTIILNAQQVNAGLSSTGATAIFNFGSIGPAGFTIIIGIVVGLAALASITIFNSGMGGEGVHILALGGVAVGIWVILSAMDGFITGNPNSLFSSLNSITMKGQANNAGIGTFLYMICSLFWLFGFTALIDRGGS